MAEALAPRRLWFWFLTILAGGSWGLFFSLARLAREGGHHPFGLTVWQGVGGGLLLLSIAAWRRYRLPLHGRALAFYLLCSVFGTALPTTLIFFVAPHLGAGFLAIAMALVPLLTYGAAILLGIDRPAALRLAGLLLGFVAIVMLMASQLGAGGFALIWALLALVVPASFTVENLLLALRAPPSTHPVALVGCFQLGGALLMAPLALATGNVMDIAVPWQQAHWASLAMLLINAFSYVLFLHVLQQVGPVFAAQATYVVTVTGVLWGTALFGEAHSAWVWLALAALLAGMALVGERKARS